MKLLRTEDGVLKVWFRFHCDDEEDVLISIMFGWDGSENIDDDEFTTSDRWWHDASLLKEQNSFETDRWWGRRLGFDLLCNHSQDRDLNIGTDRCDEFGQLWRRGYWDEVCGCGEPSGGEMFLKRLCYLGTWNGVGMGYRWAGCMRHCRLTQHLDLRTSVWGWFDSMCVRRERSTGRCCVVPWIATVGTRFRDEDRSFYVTDIRGRAGSCPQFKGMRRVYNAIVSAIKGSSILRSWCRKSGYSGFGSWSYCRRTWKIFLDGRCEFGRTFAVVPMGICIDRWCGIKKVSILLVRVSWGSCDCEFLGNDSSVIVIIGDCKLMQESGVFISFLRRGERADFEEQLKTWWRREATLAVLGCVNFRRDFGVRKTLMWSGNRGLWLDGRCVLSGYYRRCYGFSSCEVYFVRGLRNYSEE